MKYSLYIQQNIFKGWQYGGDFNTLSLANERINYLILAMSLGQKAKYKAISALKSH